VWEAEGLRALGEARLAAGVAGQAEADLTAAVEVARRQGAPGFELRAAASLARLWAEGGRRREAHDLLAPVYERFTEGLNTVDLGEARGLLDALR
jgi:predicted ATPase